MLEPIGLSIKDTGTVLGGPDRPLSRATIYRRIADGTLDARRICGRTLITMESIRSALANAPSLREAA